jgi:uncharacterized membrane protein
MLHMRAHWRVWLLILSLGVNLLLAGMIASRYLRHPGPPEDFASRMSRGMTAPDAEIMTRSFAELDGARAKMQQGRRLIEQSRALLLRPDFDPGIYATILQEASRDRAEFDRLFTAGLIQAAGKLSPEGRTSLAERRR